MRRIRLRQKAFCARYGRQAWTLWDNLPVTDLIEAVAAISELVKEENDSLRMEDR